jgi:hypothetical protein
MPSQTKPSARLTRGTSQIDSSASPANLKAWPSCRAVGRTYSVEPFPSESPPCPIDGRRLYRHLAPSIGTPLVTNKNMTGSQATTTPPAGVPYGPGAGPVHRSSREA